MKTYTVQELEKETCSSFGGSNCVLHQCMFGCVLHQAKQKAKEEQKYNEYIHPFNSIHF